MKWFLRPSLIISSLSCLVTSATSDRFTQNNTSTKQCGIQLQVLQTEISVGPIYGQSIVVFNSLGPRQKRKFVMFSSMNYRSTIYQAQHKYKTLSRVDASTAVDKFTSTIIRTEHCLIQFQVQQMGIHQHQHRHINKCRIQPFCEHSESEENVDTGNIRVGGDNRQRTNKLNGLPQWQGGSTTVKYILFYIIIRVKQHGRLRYSAST